MGDSEQGGEVLLPSPQLCFLPGSTAAATAALVAIGPHVGILRCATPSMVVLATTPPAAPTPCAHFHACRRAAACARTAN